MEQQIANEESVRRQLMALAGMSRQQLCEKWKDLYGTEPPNSSREFLRRRLAYRVQELFYGGLDTSFQTLLTPAETPSRKKSADLPDGAMISKEWHGSRYEVTIRGSKYEYEGCLYRSLSGIARKITGVNWNGREFFGLRKGEK